jgi:hypothetical protein
MGTNCAPLLADLFLQASSKGKCIGGVMVGVR